MLMSLFIFCGYYLLQAIMMNSFLTELLHTGTCYGVIPKLSDKIENSECVCVCVCVVCLSAQVQI